MTIERTSTDAAQASIPDAARDRDLVEAAERAEAALADLADAAKGPLYDPHTLFRALSRLDGAAISLTAAVGSLKDRLNAADAAGLLDTEDEDPAEAGRMRWNAAGELWKAARAAEELRCCLRDASEYTAAFKRRGGAS